VLLRCTVSNLVVQYGKDISISDWFKRSAAKLIWHLEHMTWGEAERTGSLQVGEEKIWGRSYCCLQISNGKVQRKLN